MFLEFADWETTKKISQKFQDVASTIVTNANEDPENFAQIAFILCEKLLQVGKRLQKPLNTMLTVIAQSKVKSDTHRLILTMRPEERTRYIQSLFSNLRGYLLSSKPGVYLGAAKIASNLIRDFECYLPDSYMRDIKHILPNAKLSRKLIKDSELRTDGVRLLLLSKLDIAKEGEWISKGIIECTEAKAWELFIANYKFEKPSTAIIKWVRFLEQIIRKENGLGLGIKRVVLKRYDELIRIQSQKTGIDETYLDLPLQVDPLRKPN